MNKYITATLAVIASAAILVGCGTLSQQQTNQNIQTAVTASASIGTAYDLSQRPSDLSYFIAAEQELYSIANSTNAVTTTTVEAALAQAGQTNQCINLAIATALQIGNSYISASLSTNAIVEQQVCGWIADGIAQSAHPAVLSLKAPKK
jgi:ABC-type protease/lipase transport system fused ATPase/permease subunit